MSGEVVPLVLAAGLAVPAWSSGLTGGWACSCVPACRLGVTVRVAWAAGRRPAGAVCRCRCFVTYCDLGHHSRPGGRRWTVMDFCGLLRTEPDASPRVSEFALSPRRSHSGYQSRASVTEGAGLDAQGTGSIKIAVPASN